MNHEPPKVNNEHDDQQDLERDLEALQASLAHPGDDPVSRAEPPELVDQAVLNAARRDLEGSRKRPLRWLGGFATATVVVLAVSIVLHQGPSPTEPPLADPASLEKRDSVMQKSTLRRRDENAALQEEQSLLPAAEPEAQRREAKRFKQEMNTAASIAEDQPAAAALAPPPAQAEEFRRISESVETQAIAKAPATAAMDAAEDFADSDAGLEALKEAPRSADEWLAQLLELQKSGQTEMLEDEIATFLEYYPDYPLPEALVPEKP